VKKKQWSKWSPEEKVSKLEKLCEKWNGMQESDPI
jgi:hypothetical protein